MEYKSDKSTNILTRNRKSFLSKKKKVYEKKIYDITENEELISFISELEKPANEISFIKALNYIEQEVSQYPVPNSDQLGTTSLIESLKSILLNPLYKNSRNKERERAIHIMQKIVLSATDPGFPLFDFNCLSTMMSIATEDPNLFDDINDFFQSVFLNSAFNSNLFYSLINDTPFIELFCNLFELLSSFCSLNNFFETICIIVDSLVASDNPFPLNFLEKVDFFVSLLDNPFISNEKLSNFLIQLSTNYPEFSKKLQTEKVQKTIQTILENGNGNAFKAALVLSINASPEMLMPIFYSDIILEKVKSFMYVCDEKGAESICLYFNAIKDADFDLFVAKILNILMNNFYDARSQPRFVFIYQIFLYSTEGLLNTIAGSFSEQWDNAIVCVAESLNKIDSDRLAFFLKCILNCYELNKDRMNEIFEETDFISTLSDIEMHACNEELKEECGSCLAVINDEESD